MSIDESAVGQRIADLQALIAEHATRPARLMAVTKGFGVDAATAALRFGLADLGENYAASLEEKAAALAGESEDRGVKPRWHFIGHIQRNKVRKIAAYVDTWHGVDRIAAGLEIAKRSPRAKVMVQVETPGLSTDRNGCSFADVPLLVRDLRAADLLVTGLMVVGPPPSLFESAGDWEASTRALFGRTRAEADALELPEASMGMSADLTIALEEGATIVRIGSAIFGPRPNMSTKE